MLISPLSLLALVPLVHALPRPQRRSPSGIPYTSNSIALSRRAADDSNLSKRWIGVDEPQYGPRGGNVLVGDITIGTQTFTVRFDTGSSDVWIPSKDIQCNNAVPGAVVNESNIIETISVCQFAHPGYDPALNPAFTPLDFPHTFNLTYAAGDTTGKGGKDDITVAGVTVPQQIFGIADHCDTVFGWGGTSDGVFGLAGKNLTSIHYGNDGANDTVDLDGLYLYAPWFETAWTQGIVDPYITFLLKPPPREAVLTNGNISDYGVMSIGGIPECAPESNKSVTVPNLEWLNVRPDGNDYNISWWTAAVSEFKFPGSDKIPIENNSSPLTIFDSGQSGMSIPAEAAAAFHASIKPTPLLSNITGTYYGPCNSTVPDLGLVIDNVIFTIPGDNILRANPQLFGIDAPEGYCASWLGPSVTQDTRLYMGDVFFWSVMITKDYKEKTLTFTQVE